METSETIAKLATALAAAQGEMKPAAYDKSVQIRTRTGGTYRFSYASLAVIQDVAKALQRHEIAVVQLPGRDEQGRVSVTTLLVHSSGEWIRSEMSCAPAENDVKAIGSIITYLRRYSLAAMAGICSDEDDDGSAATGDHVTKTTKSGAAALKSSLKPAAKPKMPAKEEAKAETEEPAATGGYVAGAPEPEPEPSEEYEAQREAVARQLISRWSERKSRNGQILADLMRAGATSAPTSFTLAGIADYPLVVLRAALEAE